ncbi:MAG: hypothetical protein PUD68_08680, partial [Clostridiales bacterium]|nr:hypothetical protein [Clostridiales bacterium]
LEAGLIGHMDAVGHAAAPQAFTGEQRDTDGFYKFLAIHGCFLSPFRMRFRYRSYYTAFSGWGQQLCV